MGFGDEAALEKMRRALANPDDLVKDVVELAAGVPARWSVLPLGLLIRRLRIRLHMNQGELARRAGMPQSVVSAVECGRDVRWSTLSRLFDAMGLRVLVLPMAKPGFSL